MIYTDYEQYQRKCQKREIILVVGIVFTMLMRYFESALFVGKRWLRELIPSFELYDAVEDITQYVLIFLNVAGLVVYLIDLVGVAKRTDMGNRCMLVVIWLFVRPVYFAMRAKVIKDEPGVKRGIIFGVLYAVLMIVHIWKALEAILYSIAITG